MSARSPFILVIAVAIVVVGVTSFIISKNRSSNSGARDVVVMNNGQTYFGYLSDTDKPFVTLRDVYYPQDPASVKNTNQDIKKRVSLFRFGDEVFGPESVMHLNREDIVYFSTMRDNSKINEAIDRFLDESTTPIDTTAPAQ